MTDAHLAAIRDACIRLLQLRALLRAAERMLAAEIDRARASYGFTPFAEGESNERVEGLRLLP